MSDILTTTYPTIDALEDALIDALQDHPRVAQAEAAVAGSLTEAVGRLSKVVGVVGPGSLARDRVREGMTLDMLAEHAVLAILEDAAEVARFMAERQAERIAEAGKA